VLFHKGRLIYALDRAIDSVRRGGHLVLVEGYTDVMAAHQAGLKHVAAVLGTATTDEHATLVRRSGARRVTLVFDGDEAGRRATYKALAGLLPLELEIDVVRLPGGEDPCEVLVRAGGAEDFARHLAAATGWFAHLLGELEGLPDAGRWAAVDRILELVSRLARPLSREARLEELAERLGVPVESVRAQLESLPERRRETLRRLDERAGEGEADACGEESPDQAADARLRRDWSLLVGALLVEPELAEPARAWSGRCPIPELAEVLEAALSAGGDETTRIPCVLSALGASAARSLVVPLIEETGQYENAHELFADAQRALVERAQRRELERELDGLRSGEGAQREVLARLHARLRSIKIENGIQNENDGIRSRDTGARGSPPRGDPAGVS